MYVLEYLIYHLRPFGVDSSAVAAFGPKDMSMLEKAYSMAVLNMGADDAFKKDLKDVPALIAGESPTALNDTASG